MAARPLESMPSATIMQACQTNMLVAARRSSSRQWALPLPRGSAKGTFISHMPSATTGRPSHSERARKLRGGKALMPDFMTGQFSPQTRVSRTSMRV
jgi:hypothetical protein